MMEVQAQVDIKRRLLSDLKKAADVKPAAEKLVLNGDVSQLEIR